MSCRRVAAIALALGAALLPGAGLALDVDGGLRTETEYDSNVQRFEGSGSTDDVIFRITPRVRVLEDDGKFQWYVDYRFPYDIAVETKSVDGFRHFLDAEAEYNLSERSRIFFRDRFTKSDALTNARDLDAAGTQIVNTFRNDVYRNRATLGLNHNFTQRTQGTVSFTHRYFDSDLPNRSRTNVFAGSADVSHGLSQRHRVGGGVTTTYQDFDRNNAGNRPPRQALFVNVFATWLWNLDETTSIFLRGGPTYIKNDQDAESSLVTLAEFPAAIEVQSSNLGLPVPPNEETVAVAIDPLTCTSELLASCRQPEVSDGTIVSGVLVDDPAERDRVLQNDVLVGFAPGDDPTDRSRSSWNFFAEAAISKRWRPNHVSSVSYNRTENTTTGLGSSVLDAVTALHNWQISERWTLGLRGDFTRRDSTSPINQTVVRWNPEPLPASGVFAARSFQLATERVSEDVDITTWGVRAELTRRITRHLRAGVRYSYIDQETTRDSAVSVTEFTNHLVTVGIQYDFDQYSLDQHLPW